MSAPKFAKALIGGNWKCNGTVSSVKSMAEVNSLLPDSLIQK